MKYKTIVGIDPDLSKSGLAIFSTEHNQWLCHQAVGFHDILGIIQQHGTPQDTVIVLECGWLNAKSNFRSGFSKRMSDKISKNVGENQATGKLLLATLRNAGYKVIEQIPLKKGPLKSAGKWTTIGRDFIIQNTGITSRINDEVRDAIYLIIILRGKITNPKSKL